MCVTVLNQHIFPLSNCSQPSLKKYHPIIFDSLRANPETNPVLSPGVKNTHPSISAQPLSVPVLNTLHELIIYLLNTHMRKVLLSRKPRSRKVKYNLPGVTLLLYKVTESEFKHRQPGSGVCDLSPPFLLRLGRKTPNK